MMGISMKTHNIVPLSVLMVLQLTVVSVVNQSAFDISLLDILKDTGGGNARDRSGFGVVKPPYTRRAKECLGVLAMAKCVTRPSFHSAI